MTQGETAGRRLAVVVVNYRTADLTVDCLRSLAAERGDFPDLRVVIVDGHSQDGSAERIAAGIAEDGSGDWARLLPLPVNGGFGYANNQAMLLLAADGPLPEVIALVNPDARVRPGALRALVALLDRQPRAGAAGALLEHEDGTPQGSAFTFPSIRGEFAHAARTSLVGRLVGAPPSTVTAATPIRVDWVTGAAVAFRTRALEQVGLFDDGFFLYFEETELMVRLARAGWEIWHEPAARVVHLAGRATQLRDPETGGMLAKRLPRYWFEARRRYFVRTAGPAGAVLAGAARLAGHALFKLRCALTRRDDDTPPRMLRDLAAFGMLPTRADRDAAPPGFSAAPGDTPRWMARR